MPQLVELVSGLPSHSIAQEPVLCEVFDGIYYVIRTLRQEVGLRMVSLHPRDVRLIDSNCWDAARKKCPKQEKEGVVGLYSSDRRRCYVRYDIVCTYDEVPSTQKLVRAECANTLAHEMIHKGSRGGYLFLRTLNEGITESLTEEVDVQDIIRRVVGCCLASRAYPKERQVWREMHRKDSRAGGDLLYHYWRANDGRARKIIAETFGEHVMDAFQTELEPQVVLQRIRAK